MAGNRTSEQEVVWFVICSNFKITDLFCKWWNRKALQFVNNWMWIPNWKFLPKTLIVSPEDGSINLDNSVIVVFDQSVLCTVSRSAHIQLGELNWAQVHYEHSLGYLFKSHLRCMWIILSTSWRKWSWEIPFFPDSVYFQQPPYRSVLHSAL